MSQLLLLLGIGHRFQVEHRPVVQQQLAEATHQIARLTTDTWSMHSLQTVLCISQQIAVKLCTQSVCSLDLMLQPEQASALTSIKVSNGLVKVTQQQP